MNEINTYSTDKIICPYCGAVVENVDFETFYDHDPECDQKFYCEECDHEFVASRSVSFSYESYKIGGKNESK